MKQKTKKKESPAAARRFSRLLLCLLLLGSLILPGCAASADEGGYTITDYTIHAQVHGDNSYTVDEQITVNFTEPRHGIYREIPLTVYYWTVKPGEGSPVIWHCRLEDLEVSGAESTRKNNGGTAYIQLGSADRTVEGPVTYHLRYRYIFPEDRIPDYDLVYYTLLGADWAVPVAQLQYTVSFDNGLPPQAVEAMRFYSGPRGEEGNLLGATAETDSSTLRGSLTDLPAGSAVTLLMPLPEGYFSGEVAVSRLPMYLFGGLFLLTVLLIAAASLKGRLSVRLQKKAMLNRVEMAPENICSAEIGMILDEAADDRDLLSLIPWWANQGYLYIREREEDARSSDVELEKRQNLPGNAPHYQRLLFDRLFSGRKTVRMSQLSGSFAEDFAEAKKALAEEFTGDRALSVGSGTDLLGMLAVAITWFLFLTFTSGEAMGDNWIIALLIVPPLLGAGFVYNHSLANALRRTAGSRIGRWILMGLLLFLSLVGIVFLTDDCMLSDNLVLLSFALAIAGMLFAARLYRPSAYKQAMLPQLLAFRDTLKHVEQGRLEQLLDSDPDYYYHMLPYAMVFQLEKQWTARFRKLALPRPDWYFYPGYTDGWRYYDDSTGPSTDSYDSHTSGSSGSSHSHAAGGAGSGSSHNHAEAGSSGSSHSHAASGAGNGSSHSHAAAGRTDNGSIPFNVGRLSNSLNNGVSHKIAEVVSPSSDSSSDSSSGSSGFSGGSSGGGGGGGGGGSW